MKMKLRRRKRPQILPKRSPPHNGGKRICKPASQSSHHACTLLQCQHPFCKRYKPRSGTPSAISRIPTARRPPRQLNEHLPVVRRLITCPFVILSKLSPRYGDHARHGILHVSHNQGDEVPRPSGTGTTLGETLVRLGSPDVSSRRCIADSRHPPA